MSISFGGLGSGLPVNEWIDKLVGVKQAQITPFETKLTKLKNSNSALGIIKTSFETFKSSLTAFTNILNGTTNDIFGKKIATSSSSDYITATVSAKASSGTYNLSVVQMATSTTTKSAGNSGAVLSSTTKFADIKDAKTGTLSFIFNGETKTMEIGEDDTMQDIIDNINTLFDDGAGGSLVTASIDSNGSFILKTDSSNSFSVGLAGDTSSFKNTLKLSSNPVESGSAIKTISSQSPVSLVKTTVSMVNGDANLSVPINAGTIKINGEEFTIDEGTSISDLVFYINSNKNVGVNAGYDANTNKFTLTSKSTGAIGINMEDNGTNFFNAMQLSNSASSTTLGNDAIVEINGTRISSTSNTITNTGYDGLTINLLKMPEAGKQITLDVAQDPSDVKKAVQTFVDSYNTIMKQVQEATQKDGYLEMDSSLRSIYTELRMISSSFTDSGNEFNSLAKIGVTTGKVGTAVSDETITLKFDTSVFDEAVASNLDGVKLLFSNKVDGVDIGIAGKLLKKTEDSLADVYGYFAARGDTLEKQIKIQNDKITKAYEDLELYRARIKKQFDYMDQAISKMNSQYSSFLTNTGSS